MGNAIMGNAIGTTITTRNHNKHAVTKTLGDLWSKLDRELPQNPLLRDAVHSNSCKAKLFHGLSVVAVECFGGSVAQQKHLQRVSIACACSVLQCPQHGAVGGAHRWDAPRIEHTGE